MLKPSDYPHLTFRPDATELALLAKLQRSLGVQSRSAAIRQAIRMAAEATLS